LKNYIQHFISRKEATDPNAVGDANEGGKVDSKGDLGDAPVYYEVIIFVKVFSFSKIY